MARKISPSQVSAVYGAHLDNSVAKLLTRAANTLIIQIRRRSIAGLDSQGQAMPPYSPQYAKKKGYSTPRNLTVTGRMLGAITFRILSRSKFVIYFMDEASRRKARHTTNHLKGRRWFGLNEGDFQILRRVIQPK